MKGHPIWERDCAVFSICPKNVLGGNKYHLKINYTYIIINQHLISDISIKKEENL